MKKRVMEVANQLFHLSALHRRSGTSDILVQELDRLGHLLEEAIGFEPDPKADEEFVGMSELQLKDKLLRIQTVVENIEKSAKRIVITSADWPAIQRARDIGSKCWEIYDITGIKPKKIRQLTRIEEDENGRQERTDGARGNRG